MWNYHRALKPATIEQIAILSSHKGDNYIRSYMHEHVFIYSQRSSTSIFEPRHEISQQCSVLARIDSEPVQPPVKLRNSKCCSVSSLTVIEYSSDVLIRLHVCAGWSEPSLVTHTTLLEISCCGSFVWTSSKGTDETAWMRKVGWLLYFIWVLVVMIVAVSGLCFFLVKLRTSIRAVWSDFLLVAHTTLLEILCCGSFV